jgi:Mn2+/Fe2+ NRAMP family transporter
MQIYLQSAIAERGGQHDLASTRADAYTGATFGDLISGAIIIATGTTLYRAGIKVETAADAALALSPLAGHYAELLFSIGVFGAAMLAAAALPLATAYPITEAFGLEKGISRSFREAPAFHGLFTGMILIGTIVALLPGLNVISLLVYTQVLNGLLLPVELIAMLHIVNDREVMGQYTNGRLYNLIAWLTVIVVIALSTIYLVITVLGLIGISVGT